MKVLTVFGLLVGAVAAQNCLNVALAEIPSCAQSCFLTGAPSIGCGGTDFACQCEKEAALYAAIEGCVSSGCPEPSFQVVIDGASSVCNCATGGAPAATTTGAAATTTGAAATATGSFATSGSFASSGSFATSAASTSSTGTVIGAFTGLPYTPQPTLTPTATAAAPVHRAALGLFGGVAAVVVVAIV